MPMSIVGFVFYANDLRWVIKKAEARKNGIVDYTAVLGKRKIVFEEDSNFYKHLERKFFDLGNDRVIIPPTLKILDTNGNDISKRTGEEIK